MILLSADVPSERTKLVSAVPSLSTSFAPYSANQRGYFCGDMLNVHCGGLRGTTRSVILKPYRAVESDENFFVANVYKLLP